MFKRHNGFAHKSFGKREGGTVIMHKTSCASCGNSCEVPFKPNGKKPVLCGDCFHKDDHGGEKMSFRSSDRSARGEEKVSYPATCGDCGARCMVPFKPMQGKPVKCRECFVPGDRPASNSNAASGISQEQFQMLNTKLDTILKALGTKGAAVRGSEEPSGSRREGSEGAKGAEGGIEKPAKKAWAKLKYKK